ncbi:putative aminopeptidase [Cystobacter fuscus DSM 2262]|uniref:Aminopeptidase n=1 Tax=Cystobacter fuscus (strain ATCC 25194 / DSM 2262 / NBRC 100088 / M29) TaxID=1242864 RepID=S9P0G4_CYSF2|nr:M1 family aminopeptidase [Cystobacter fuscus]EPX57945.1 putative aminopeptidase [Cystobacter fuscus DSM 2262]
MRVVASTDYKPRARGRLSTVLFLGGVLGTGCGDPNREPTPGDGCSNTTCEPGAQGQEIIGDRQYNVLQYKYGIDLTSRQASSELVVQPSETIDCLSIPGPASVQNVSWQWGGTSVLQGFNWSNEHLNICSTSDVDGTRGPSIIKSTYTVPEATYDYSQVGFSRRQDFSGGQFTYLLGWVESCDLFGPCDDAADQLTRVSFTVDHPENQLVLCPGVRTTPSNRQTRCDLPANVKAPTYSSFAVASNPNWVETQFLTSPVSVKFYEVPNGRLLPALNRDDVSHFLGWITGQLGALPYGSELRIASGPTDWLGMEHPANIILRDDLPLLRKDYANMTLHTLMHEVVHQWAGNRTTLASKWDFAWKEALADYMTYLYEEQYRGGEAGQTRVYWDRLARGAAYYLQPQDNPAPNYITFVNNVYGSGPMILFLQLEPLIGKDKVLAGIKRFLSSPTARSIDDLRTEMQIASGKDLAPYFNAWVKRSGEPNWPYYEYVESDGWNRANGKLTFKVAQHSDIYYPGYVEVEVSFHNRGDKRIGLAKFELTGQNKEVTVEVPVGDGWEPSGFVVDPNSKFVNSKLMGLTAEPEPIRWRL